MAENEEAQSKRRRRRRLARRNGLKTRWRLGSSGWLTLAAETVRLGSSEEEAAGWRRGIYLLRGGNAAAAGQKQIYWRQQPAIPRRRNRRRRRHRVFGFAAGVKNRHAKTPAVVWRQPQRQCENWHRRKRQNGESDSGSKRCFSSMKNASAAGANAAGEN
jgi:hypothetical protein